ncbi:MAG: hypothetical protein M3Y91_00885, partial [Actinomycetota bacterium]|nr:hypothetical protein [Actinomycetota bacterium]
QPESQAINPEPGPETGPAVVTGTGLLVEVETALRDVELCPPRRARAGCLGPLMWCRCWQDRRQGWEGR